MKILLNSLHTKQELSQKRRLTELPCTGKLAKTQEKLLISKDAWPQQIEEPCYSSKVLRYSAL